MFPETDPEFIARGRSNVYRCLLVFTQLIILNFVKILSKNIEKQFSKSLNEEFWVNFVKMLKKICKKFEVDFWKNLS